MQKNTYKIGGMTCAACASGLERVLKKLEGVDSVYVNFATETLNITYIEKVEFSNIESAIQSLGFYIKKSDEQIKDKKINLIILIVLTLILLYIAMTPMINGLESIYPSFLLPNNNPILFAIIQLLLCIPVILIGYRFYTVGIMSLFKKSPNMDTLVAIGTLASFIYSVISVIQIFNGNDHFVHNLYFESTATIITLVTLGKYLEAKSKNSTKNAVQKLLDLSPKKSVVERNNEILEIDVNDILVGDIVIVKAGEKISVDGIITFGNASIDETMVTGESVPIDKQDGDNVIGGTIVTSGYIKYEAKTVLKDTMLSHIIRMVEEAQSSKAPISKIADKVSGYFVTVVIILAVVSFIFWYLLNSDLAFALNIFVSVLVIACPCALGLATPLAIIVANGRGAIKGILFKNAEVIEILNKVKLVIFDKTGTITEGKMFVTDIIEYRKTKTEVLQIACSLEQYSEHPLAKAIINENKDNGLNLHIVNDYKTHIGNGVSGIVNNKMVHIGSIKFVKFLNINIKECENDIQNITNQGKTPVIICEEYQVTGIISVSDIIKENSIQLISKLKNIGIKPIMLTGDTRNTAVYIANIVGINESNIKYEVLPLDKANIVKQYQEREIVAMVGDGINDSPALSQADIGIAVGNGNDIAIESADIVLIQNDIYNVYNAIKLSKHTMRIIKQNLFWAFVYNILGIPIAMGVFYLIGGPLLTPMIAALAMVFSSIMVVFNSLRINRIKL